MSNLKTDDIIGARPRVRHAPRNLIRDQHILRQNQKYPYSLPNSGAYMSNQDKKYAVQYPYALNSSQQRQQDNYHNINLSESLHQDTPLIAGKSSNRINGSIKIIDRFQQNKFGKQKQKILAKQPPIISYDSLKMNDNKQQSTTYGRNYNMTNRQIYQKYQKSLDNKHYLQDKNFAMRAQDVHQRGRSRASNSAIQSKSINKTGQIQHMGNINQQNNEQAVSSRNIFKGLGYNIITNSKFAYGMENRYKNSTSKWLE